MTTFNFPGVHVPAGETITAPQAVSAGISALNLKLTRGADWPSGGCDIRIEASVSGIGGPYTTKAGPQHIDPFIPTAKEPNSTPAQIGYGWDPAQFQAPTHVRAAVVTPAPFITDLTITAT